MTIIDTHNEFETFAKQIEAGLAAGQSLTLKEAIQATLDSSKLFEYDKFNLLNTVFARSTEPSLANEALAFIIETPFFQQCYPDIRLRFFEHVLNYINPQRLPDIGQTIFGSTTFGQMSDRDKARIIEKTLFHHTEGVQYYIGSDQVIILGAKNSINPEYKTAYYVAGDRSVGMVGGCQHYFTENAAQLCRRYPFKRSDRRFQRSLIAGALQYALNNAPEGLMSGALIRQIKTDIKTLTFRIMAWDVARLMRKNRGNTINIRTIPDTPKPV